VPESSVFLLFTYFRVCIECKESYVTVFRTMATASNTEAVLVVLRVVIVERLHQQINDVAK
jgi:hypothetical protein